MSLWRLIDGRLRFDLHHGQRAAMASRARVTLVQAGTQSGKTVFGPAWLLREIVTRGAGEYMVVTPTYPLLEKKALPAFIELFGDVLGWGGYVASRHVFEFNRRGRSVVGGRVIVFFGYAANPDSLESATARAAWLDEAGQRSFKLGAYEAIQRRLSIHTGRTLITTTPYGPGWLELLPRRAGVEVIQFSSLLNPSFPVEEYERARAELPPWRFSLFYEGRFTRPPGLVYDCFKSEHIVPRAAVDLSWPVYLGVDFGGVNTAAVYVAVAPDGRLYVTRTLKLGKASIEDMAARINSVANVVQAWGGAGSEEHWRREYRKHGLAIGRPTYSDVELAISQVYAVRLAGRLLVVDDCEDYINEVNSYSRVTDESGMPTQTIQNAHDYHIMDAERYVVPQLAEIGKSESHVIPGEKMVW